MTSPFASWLRAQSSLTGTPPALDLSALPDEPMTLFAAWAMEAVDHGVAEPHAVTLATVDATGTPDARALLVKDVSERGWAFAGPRSSEKAAQLAAVPRAAMNFWWQPIRRAVRVRGAVHEASAEESAADLAERSPAARDDLGSGEWVRWWLEPVRVEFWQGAEDRRHGRIVYSRDHDGWSCSITNGERKTA